MRVLAREPGGVIMRHPLSTHAGLTTPHLRGSPMPVCLWPVRLTCVSLIILAGIAGDALAACTEWERHWLLPKLGCSQPAIEAICAGQRSNARHPSSWWHQLPPAGMAIGASRDGRPSITRPGSLASTCECQTSGMVHGWVSQKCAIGGIAGPVFDGQDPLPASDRLAPGRAFCPSAGHTAPSTPKTASILMSALCSPAPWWGSPVVLLCRHVTGTALALSTGS